MVVTASPVTDVEAVPNLSCLSLNFGNEKVAALGVCWIPSLALGRDSRHCNR